MITIRQLLIEIGEKKGERRSILRMKGSQHSGGGQGTGNKQ